MPAYTAEKSIIIQTKSLLVSNSQLSVTYINLIADFLQHACGYPVELHNVFN